MNKNQDFINIINDFYKNELHLSNEEFAKKYLNIFYKYESSWEYGEAGDLYNPIENIINREIKLSGENVIALSSDDSSLNSLTKRVPLIAERSIFSHTSGESLIYSKESITAMTYDKVDIYATCPDLINLGSWLKSCKEIITNGLIFYFPNNIRVFDHSESGMEGTKNKDNHNYKYLPDLVIKERTISQIFNDSIPVNKYIKPITTLDLPYIENTDLKNYSKIMVDESQSVAMLRIFLKEQFLTISEQEGSESYFLQVEKMKVEMQKGVKLISKDINRLKKKNSFLASGATISSLAATLVAINSDVFSIWSKTLGASGGLFLFHKLFEQNFIEKQKIKESPFYYLWVLHNKSI